MADPKSTVRTSRTQIPAKLFFLFVLTVLLSVMMSLHVAKAGHTLKTGVNASPSPSRSAAAVLDCQAEWDACQDGADGLYQSCIRMPGMTQAACQRRAFDAQQSCYALAGCTLCLVGRIAYPCPHDYYDSPGLMPAPEWPIVESNTSGVQASSVCLDRALDDWQSCVADGDVDCETRYGTAVFECRE